MIYKIRVKDFEKVFEIDANNQEQAIHFFIENYVILNKEVKDIKIIVDYGKPYEETLKDIPELKNKLKELRRLAESGEYAYFDVDVEINGKRLNSDEIDQIENE